MKKSFGEYTRLAKGAFGCSSLWAGEEHLLYVRGSGIIWPISETYRRIRYADITALTAAPSPGSIVWISLSAAWLLMFSIPAIITTFNGTEIVVPIILATFAIPGLVVLVYNLIRGRTCVYAIETASGILKIRTANRLKVARRVSTSLEQKIRALQQPQ